MKSDIGKILWEQHLGPAKSGSLRDPKTKDYLKSLEKELRKDERKQIAKRS